MENLEQLRKEYAKALLKPIAIGVAIDLALILMIVVPQVAKGNFSSNSFAIIFQIIFFTIFIEIMLPLFLARKKGIAYKKAYKAFFVESSLQNIFTELFYSHEIGMSKFALDQTDMINTGDRYSSNDFVSGKYKDVKFSQADVKIEEEHEDSDGDKSYTTIFKGRWMEFEFPKQFNFRLEIAQKWFPAKKVPKANTGKKLNRIDTESPTFNKKFKIYAEDGFEAFYILDPAMIEHIEALTDQHKAKYLLCFNQNKLSVAIHDRKDAFEPPSPLKAIDKHKELAKVNGEIQLITNIVDYLRLDHKLFKNKWYN